MKGLSTLINMKNVPRQKQIYEGLHEKHKKMSLVDIKQTSKNGETCQCSWKDSIW